ncbi:MAG TPA: malto-oligosyltrehalose trehalohydrolase [Burkholderiales bacterium]|nr:malto-oligosyltrehalose trehalohydrolase [Burkholderiales bacterium]
MPFGASVLADGRVRFRLWAPAAERVEVAIEGGTGSLAMQTLPEGWHELTTHAACAGSLYRFVLPDGTAVPDPASRFQPHDVHGPSAVVDPRQYAWRNPDWAGRPWEQAVVYELHVGTFSGEGTFRAIVPKLQHLVALGVTAIELMPIGDFPGSRNWGYDGVLPYAPDSAYGTPEDLKALIDAAHDLGVMVILDVVYNHFGPDGNYLSLYSPQFFTERHQTPWGAAVNFDDASSSVVREFVIHNALYWLEEYRFDGLRLDAVHAIVDESPTHLLEELSTRARALAGDRKIHLVLENEHNVASLLERNPDGSPRFYTAQWNDDVHHVLHTAATGERTGYYSEYTGDSVKLGRALAEGFAFQGETMQCSGRARGEASGHLPPTAFVAFIQNHDQVGNRARGERLGMIAPAEAVRAAAAVYLLLPQIPMLFMGEEWNASQPFPFFCDFPGELGKAVSAGRRQEFAAFQDAENRPGIPDPQASETFESARLDWAALAAPPHAQWLQWYTRILRVRAGEIVPRLREIASGGRFEVLGPGVVSVTWGLMDGSLNLTANLSSRPAENVPAGVGRELWLEGALREDGALLPWTVRWFIDPP